MNLLRLVVLISRLLLRVRAFVSVHIQHGCLILIRVLSTHEKTCALLEVPRIQFSIRIRHPLYLIFSRRGVTWLPELKIILHSKQTIHLASHGKCPAYCMISRGKLCIILIHPMMEWEAFCWFPIKMMCFMQSWKDEKGSEHRTDLPSVKTSGIVLRILNSNSKVVFSVSRPAENQAYQQLIVVAHMNQQMVYKATVNLKDISMNGGNIPTQQLPTGILQVTVFNK